MSFDDSDPPNLEALVIAWGGYDKIPPEAWAGYDREMAAWRIRMQGGKEYIVTPAPAPDELEDREDEAAPRHLVDEYRSRYKLPRRIINRELYRQYKDETNWSDKEQEVLKSRVIRHDLRHLLAHGDCHFGLTRQLLDFYRAARGGQAPVDIISYRINATDEKAKQPQTFDQGGHVGACSEMQELVGSLDSVQGHFCVGWFSFHEWHGPTDEHGRTIMEELISMREREEAAHRARMAQSRQGLRRRLKLFESIESRLSPPKKRQARK